MNSEQEPINTPDAELHQPQVDSEPTYPPAGYVGELPGGGGLPQPADNEVITEIPGFEGNGATKPSIHDSNPDQVAIALARKLQAAEEYARVAGQMALPPVPADNNNPEQ